MWKWNCVCEWFCSEAARGKWRSSYLFSSFSSCLTPERGHTSWEQLDEADADEITQSLHLLLCFTCWVSADNERIRFPSLRVIGPSAARGSKSLSLTFPNWISVSARATGTMMGWSGWKKIPEPFFSLSLPLLCAPGSYLSRWCRQCRWLCCLAAASMLFLPLLQESKRSCACCAWLIVIETICALDLLKPGQNTRWPRHRHTHTHKHKPILW